MLHICRHALATAALACAAVPALAQLPAPMPPTGAATTQAMPYLFKAGQSDVFEITTSQIALMRSQNPAVRQFATMLIDHHTRTTNLALAAARQAGVMPPPPVLDTRQKMMIDQLFAAAPAEFDRVYIAQQVPAHQEALALHSGYAQQGDAAPLRMTARGAVPIVTSHLQRAQAMQNGRM